MAEERLREFAVLLDPGRHGAAILIRGDNAGIEHLLLHRLVGKHLLERRIPGGHDVGGQAGWAGDADPERDLDVRDAGLLGRGRIELGPALGTGDRSAILALATTLDNANNGAGGCPLS